MLSLFIVLALLGSGLAQDSPEESIQNGSPAKDGDLPYQVGLKMNTKPPTVCGGALISTTQILTAARCVDKVPANDITAYLGSITLGKGTEKKAKKVTVHPNYDAKEMKNNIALVNIDAVAASKTIGVINLPRVDKFVEGRVSIASGWGNTGSTQSDTLLKANLFVFSPTACAEHLKKNPNDFKDPIFCTAAPSKAIGCVGDWGGPLMFSDTKELIGIMSSGPDGCNPAKSHVTLFTKVFAFKDWISKTK